MSKPFFSSLFTKTIHFIDGDELAFKFQDAYGWLPEPVAHGEVSGDDSEGELSHYAHSANYDPNLCMTEHTTNDSTYLYNFLDKLVKEGTINKGNYRIQYMWG
jgi:hypothetical protein